MGSRRISFALAAICYGRSIIDCCAPRPFGLAGGGVRLRDGGIAWVGRLFFHDNREIQVVGKLLIEVFQVEFFHGLLSGHRKVKPQLYHSQPLAAQP